MKKYRPYLTLEQLQHLCINCTDYQTKRYLDKYIRDIDEGFRVANAIVADPITVQLGMSEKEKKTAYEAEQERRYVSDEMSAEEEKQYELSQGVKIP